MKKKIVVELVLLLLFLSSTAGATIWYVHPDSTLNSIQAALDSCSDYDTVLVAQGIYYENIVWHNIQGIHLKSESGPSATIIDGSGSSVIAVITITILADTSTIIDGFSIRNGSASFGGGGIYSESGSPTIVNNIITSNAASIYGGGIYCSVGSPIIARNIITGNSSEKGGGIYCAGSTPIIKINSITGNSAASGAGIYCGGSSPSIDSCTISSNNGDGVFCESESNPVINYNNITDNTGYGVRNVDDTVIVNAEYNWWGDASGPGGNGPGIGDEVSEYVDYDPWLGGPVGKVETETPKIENRKWKLTIYPNPFTTSTTINLPRTSEHQNTRVSELEIYDMSGRLVKSVPLTTNHLSLGTDFYPGIYFLKVDGVNVGKVVKVR